MENIEPVEGEAQPIPAPAEFLPLAQQALIVIVVIAVFLGAWQLFAETQNIPTFFLPKPTDIARRFFTAWNDGTLPRHVSITWSEAVIAFALAFTFSCSLGYILAKSPLLEKIVSPFIIASQSLPIFAIAPFVLIILGNGFWSNALMGALVAFFPMLVTMISALRHISNEQRAVLQSYAASPRDVFTKLEIPASLPYIFSSIRVGITLSVIGVLVVELFWADRGIGYLLNAAQKQLFDTPLLFAGILALILMNLSMYVAVALLQRILMPWHSTSA